MLKVWKALITSMMIWKNSVGLRQGRVMDLNFCQALAPSMEADSYRSSGILRMPALMKMKLMPVASHTARQQITPKV